MQFMSQPPRRGGPSAARDERTRPRYPAAGNVVALKPLSPTQEALRRALSVFPQTFSAECALAILGDDFDLQAFQALVECGQVVEVDAAPAPRYRLLSPIANVAPRDRFVDYFVTRANDATRIAAGRCSADERAHLRRDLENWVAALEAVVDDCATPPRQRALYTLLAAIDFVTETDEWDTLLGRLLSVARSSFLLDLELARFRRAPNVVPFPPSLDAAAGSTGSPERLLAIGEIALVRGDIPLAERCALRVRGTEEGDVGRLAADLLARARGIGGEGLDAGGELRRVAAMHLLAGDVRRAFRLGVLRAELASRRRALDEASSVLHELQPLAKVVADAALCAAYVAAVRRQADVAAAGESPAQANDADAPIRIRVARGGGAFEVAGRHAVIGPRPVLRAVLHAVAARFESGESAVPVEDVVAAAWPEQRRMDRSARMRVDWALSVLRGLGLRGLRRVGECLIAEDGVRLELVDP